MSRRARKFREQRGLSLRQAARLLAKEYGVNVNYSTISYFETGKWFMGEARLIAYAKLLGVSVDDLMASEEAAGAVA